MNNVNDSHQGLLGMLRQRGLPAVFVLPGRLDLRESALLDVHEGADVLANAINYARVAGWSQLFIQAVDVLHGTGELKQVQKAMTGMTSLLALPGEAFLCTLSQTKGTSPIVVTIRCNTVGSQSLSALMADETARAEWRFVSAALQRHGNDLDKTAEELQISRTELEALIKEFQ